METRRRWLELRSARARNDELSRSERKARTRGTTVPLAWKWQISRGVTRVLFDGTSTEIRRKWRSSMSERGAMLRRRWRIRWGWIYGPTRPPPHSSLLIPSSSPLSNPVRGDGGETTREKVMKRPQLRHQFARARARGEHKRRLRTQGCGCTGNRSISPECNADMRRRGDVIVYIRL